jgi:hypothetical protein
MDAEQLRVAISRYVPHETVRDCVEWITRYRIAVRVTRSRSSKYGDYSSPHNGKGHRISVNHDLNPYAFLITFTHEVAHLVTYTKYRRHVNAHGKEWQLEYRQLMEPFLHRNVFPDDLALAVAVHIRKPSASSCSDQQLQRILRRYDNNVKQTLVLEDIPENTRFRIGSGREFVKGKMVRKNYSCMDVKNSHTYFINPLTEVVVCREEPEGNMLFTNEVDPII